MTSVRVEATIGQEKYYTEVKAGNNLLITDEPLAKGGGNKGFNPFEILATSLASCTAATLKMYIDHKGWDIKEIKVEVILESNLPISSAVFSRKITFHDADISEDQKTRLFKIAESCPVHKVLQNPITINTSIH
ncbi:MAG: OsmC family protein [Saprospiraceae bacterium]|nr:OsmC family protein [Saprospiraceae bacterium]